MIRALVIVVATLFIASCGPQTIQTTKNDPIWTLESDPYVCLGYPATCE